MLNKELLMSYVDIPVGGVLLKVGREANEELIGFMYGYERGKFGSVNKVPYWEDFGSYDEMLAFWFAPDGKTHFILKNSEHSSARAPQRLAVTVTANGVSHLFMFDGFATNAWANGDIYRLEDNYGKVIGLTFDPPHWVLGSRNTRTNLEYYAEEAPWEAQDAEQGTFADGWCEAGSLNTSGCAVVLYLYRHSADSSSQKR